MILQQLAERRLLCLLEFDLGIDVGEFQLAIDGGQFQGGVETGGFVEKPLPVVAAGETFDMRMVLADEDVFLERFDLKVMFKLFAAVGFLVRVRKVFYNNLGVE